MTPAYDAGRHVADEQWLCLHRNENQFVSGGLLQSMLARASALNPARYPDSRSDALKQRLAELHGVQPGNIHIGNGSDGVLADLVALLRSRHINLHLPRTGYKVYDLLARRHGFHVSRYDSSSAVVEAPGVWLIDSPNAITGQVMRDDCLRQLASHPDALVVWDNCYGDFEAERLAVPPLQRMVVVRSFSKYYGLAGLRIGYCLASQALVAELDAHKDVYNVNAVAQAAALQALEHADIFRAGARRMRHARRQLVEGMRWLGFDVSDPSGNFVFAGHPQIAGADLQRGLEAHHILVRRFDHPGIQDRIRMAVPHEDDLARVFDALLAVLARHGQQDATPPLPQTLPEAEIAQG